MTQSASKKSSSAQPKPKWRLAIGEFWQGFTELAGLSLAICLGGAVLSLIAVLWLYSPKTMASSWGDYIPRSSVDADAFATVEALRIAHHPSDNPRLLILGSSTLAQAFGSGQKLQNDLMLGTGQSWDIHMLTTPLQGPLDQLALIETALSGQSPDDPQVVIVLGAGVQRLTWSVERMMELAQKQRIGFRSDWADAEIREIGGTPAPRNSMYVFENWDFFLLNGMKSMTRAALGRPAQRVIDVFAFGKKNHQNAEYITQRIINYETNLEFFLQQQSRIIERIKSVPNTTLVLIDEPILPDPELNHEFRALEARFFAEMERFSDAQQVHYWTVMQDSNLKEDDFHDPFHLERGEAQEICQTTLASWMIRLTQELGQQSG